MILIREMNDCVRWLNMLFYVKLSHASDLALINI